MLFSMFLTKVAKNICFLICSLSANGISCTLFVRYPENNHIWHCRPHPDWNIRPRCGQGSFWHTSCHRGWPHFSRNLVPAWPDGPWKRQGPVWVPFSATCGIPGAQNFSMVYPWQLQVFCAWQERAPLNQTGSSWMKYIQLFLYAFRWNIEVSYYEQKTFWSYCGWHNPMLALSVDTVLRQPSFVVDIFDLCFYHPSNKSYSFFLGLNLRASPSPARVYNPLLM